MWQVCKPKDAANVQYFIIELMLLYVKQQSPTSKMLNDDFVVHSISLKWWDVLKLHYISRIFIEWEIYIHAFLLPFMSIEFNRINYSNYVAIFESTIRI